MHARHDRAARRRARAPTHRSPRRGGAWHATGLRRAESRALAATLTLLLHASIVGSLLRGTASVPQAARPGATFAMNAHSLRDAGERLVGVELVPDDVPTHGVLCAGSTYVGIGIAADPRTQRIILVGDDTPAARAGLQHDDIVLNPEVWGDAHHEGALLRLLIVREGVKMIVPVRVGWICTG